MTAIEVVSDLLRTPDRFLTPPENPRDRWDRLTKSSAFVDSLRNAIDDCAPAEGRAVTSDDFHRWKRSLAQWEEGYSQVGWWNKDRDRTRELNTARGLLDSARRAALKETPRSAGTDGFTRSPGRGEVSSTSLLATFMAYEAWFGWCRRAQESKTTQLRPVTVPIALYDEITGTGYVADVTFELFNGQGPFCARHPKQAFVPVIESFAGSVADALEGARLRLGLDSAPRSTGATGVLWQVHARDPLRGGLEPDGRSASGAVLRALMHGLLNQVPDAGVMIIAEVNPADQRKLLPTDSTALKAKVKGVAEDFIARERERRCDLQIDRIGVVEKAEKTLAEWILRTHFDPEPSPIRVVLVE